MVRSACLLTLTLTLATSSAHAERRTPRADSLRQPEVHRVPPTGLTLPLALHPELQTTLTFAHRITDTSGKLLGVAKPRRATKNRLDLSVEGPRVAGNLRVEFANTFVVLVLRLSPSPEAVTHHLAFTPISAAHQADSRAAAHYRQQARQAKARAHQATRAAEQAKAREQDAKLAAKEARRGEAEAKAREKEARREAKQREQRHRRTRWRDKAEALYDEVSRPTYTKKFLQPNYTTDTTGLELFAASWADPDHLLQPFRLTNQGAQPLRLDPPAATVGARTLTPHTTFFNTPHMDPFVLPPGKQIAGALIFPFKHLPPTNVKITLGADIKITITAWVSQVLHYQASARDLFFQNQRENEQLIIHARAIAGAFWLSNGLAAARDLKATTFYGGGLRVTKGISELFALEAELVAGQTGSANFSAPRRAKFGRLQAGVAFRLGHQNVPIVRFGVGLLAAVYDETPESGDSSEFSVPFGLGFGYLYRLSEEWVLSTSATAIGSTDELRSLEAGIQLGYGFTPGGYTVPE